MTDYDTEKHNVLSGFINELEALQNVDAHLVSLLMTKAHEKHEEQDHKTLYFTSSEIAATSGRIQSRKKLIEKTTELMGHTDEIEEIEATVSLLRRDEKRIWSHHQGTVISDEKEEQES